MGGFPRICTATKGIGAEDFQIVTDAFGNALGSSLAEAASSQGTSIMGAGPVNSSQRFGELGSGSYGIGDVDGLTFFGASPQNMPATVASSMGAQGATVPLVDHRSSEREYRELTEESVGGSGYRAVAGDSISRILGTSKPQAVGNFMRANGLTSSTIEAGRSYFVPDSTSAYGDSTAAGQAVLIDDNARQEAIATQGASQQPVTHLSEGQQVAYTGENNGLLMHAGEDFAKKAVRAYANGKQAEGDQFLSYASEYYGAYGEAQVAANHLAAQAPKFQLPPAETGASPGDLKFELKLGGAAYAIIGGNFDVTATVNVSRPMESSLTEFEGGIGLGAGFKAKAGLELLREAAPSASIPLPALRTFGSGQAAGTGAVGSKVEIEGAIPFFTISAMEAKAGLQSPLTGRQISGSNYGAFNEIKFFETKVSPALNVGWNLRWDVFNTSYKK